MLFEGGKFGFWEPGFITVSSLSTATFKFSLKELKEIKENNVVYAAVQYSSLCKVCFM
jgi:hypothetical protein